MKQILLADDHHIVRQGIQMIIENLIDECEIKHAASLVGIRQAFEQNAFNFAILDAQLPDGNCMEILKEFKAKCQDVKILVFSSFEEETYALKFLDGGADGFLSKLSDENEIEDALAQLFENGYYHSTLTQTLLKLAHIQPNVLNPLNQLSQREMEIAVLYSKGHGNLEIANQLSIRQNTVSTYKKRIFEKLEINKMIDLIEVMKKYHDF